MAPVSELARRLTLGRPADGAPDAFVGDAYASEGRVFGGLIVAQALRAAQATVAPRHWPHSLHASFLRSPRGALLAHRVERSRDGASFAIRRVVVEDRSGEAVLLMTASFHAPEPGPSYQVPGPAVPLPGPERLGPGRYDGPVFDCRDVPATALGEDVAPHARRMWFRARGELLDDPALHLWGLAMATDHGPTRAVREPHADHPGVEGRMSASLDHSVWFHRPARVDQWLLSELVPYSTEAGRGLAVGTIRTQSGELVATVAQEVVLRLA